MIDFLVVGRFAFAGARAAAAAARACKCGQGQPSEQLSTLSLLSPFARLGNGGSKMSHIAILIMDALMIAALFDLFAFSRFTG